MDTAARAILRQSHPFYRDFDFVITFHTRVHEGICRLKFENMLKGGFLTHSKKMLLKNLQTDHFRVFPPTVKLVIILIDIT